MSKPCVVFADDNVSIRKVMKKIAELAGVKGVLVENGIQALDAIRQDRPALAVLDVMMPHMSGFEVCYAIKNDPSLVDIKVFIVTASTVDHPDDDESWREKCGADAFFTKPVNTKHLLKEIQMAVGIEVKAD